MNRSESDNKEIILPLNLYGYRVNVNHPKINALYKRYKKWKNIPHTQPMSDCERFEFEGYILKKLGLSESLQEVNKNDS